MKHATFAATSTVGNADVRPIGANIESMGRDFQNYISTGPGERRSTPPITARARPVEAVSTTTGTGRRLDTSELSDYGLYEPIYWVGGTVDLWSTTDNILSLYRTSEIVGAGVDYIEIADDGGSTDIQAGDMMVLRRFTDEPKSTYSTGPIGEVWRVVTAPMAPRNADWPGDDTDAPARWREDATGWYGEYDIQTLVSSKHFLPFATTDGADQFFYAILQPGVTYRIEVTAWADANATVELTYSNLQSHTVTEINGSPTTDTFPVTFNVTTTETTYSLEFEVASQYAGGGAQALRLYFRDAEKYYIRGPLKFYDASADFAGLTASEATRFGDANLDYIRDHNIVKTDQPGLAYDLNQLIRDYIHATLTNVVALGHTRFWFQPEYYIYNEAAELYEYLCGTADGSTPWADLRASLGRTAPWTDDLHFLFEISNELWISTNTFQTWPNMTDRGTGLSLNHKQLQGMFLQQRFIDVFKAQPGYDASKWTYVCGGRYNSEDGDAAAMYAPDATIVARAPYVGGWEVGGETPTSSPEDLFILINWPPTITANRLEESDGWIAEAKTNAFEFPFYTLPSYSTGANANLKGATYEDALGYSSSTNTPQEEKRVYRTKLAATAWLDKLARQSSRYSAQSLFTLKFGDTWSSHDPASGRAWPFHMWNEVFNAHVAPAEHREVTMTSGPTRDVTIEGALSTGRGPHSYTDVPEVGCYIFKKSNGWAAIVTNRNIPYDSIDSQDALYDATDDGSRVVEVSVDSGSYTLTKRTMSGAWNAHNYDSADANFDADMEIVETELGINDGTVREMIPAANAVVYVWEA